MLPELVEPTALVDVDPPLIPAVEVAVVIEPVAPRELAEELPLPSVAALVVAPVDPVDDEPMLLAVDREELAAAWV